MATASERIQHEMAMSTGENLTWREAVHGGTCHRCGETVAAGKVHRYANPRYSASADAPACDEFKAFVAIHATGSTGEPYFAENG